MVMSTAILTLVLATLPDGSGPLGLIPEPGHGTFAITQTSFLSRLAFDDEGRSIPQEPLLLRTQTVQAVGVLGVAPRLALWTAVPFVIATTSDGPGGALDSFRSDVGPGDWWTGLRLSLFDSPLLGCSLVLDAKLPLYEGAPRVLGRRAGSLDPARGDGQVDVVGGVAGSAVFPFGGGLDVDLAYVLRTGDVTDATRLRVAVRIPVLAEAVVATARVEALVTFAAAGSGAPDETVGQGGGTAAVGALVRATDDLAIFADAGLFTRAQNAAAGTLLSSGVRLTF